MQVTLYAWLTLGLWEPIEPYGLVVVVGLAAGSKIGLMERLLVAA